MELIKENVRVNQVSCKGTVKTELNEDIIVPDVKPDILKILQLDASAYITDKNVSDGRATVSGRADLKILYIPEGSDEKIKSITSSFDFSQNIDNSCISGGMTVVATANVDRAEFSLINSRKLRVKLTICTDYEVVEEKSIEISVDAENSGNAEILKESVSLQNCIGLMEREFSLHEDMEIPISQTAASEILKADARISDSEYKTVTGKIIVKGACEASVLYTDAEGGIRFLESEIPFTEVFELDDAGDETICDIDYSVHDISCEIKEDSDGENRVIGMAVTVCAQIKATENIHTDMIADCYEPFMNTELIREEAELEEVVSRPSAQNTIREMIETDEGAPAVSGVYDVITKSQITNASLGGGRLLAEGKVDAYILYLTDSDDTPAYSIKREIPFSYSLNTDYGSNVNEAELVPEIKAEVRHTAYNLNMAGEIELRCILSLGANIIRKRRIELINDIVTEGRNETEKKGIVIYFVQQGDTLWNIAKRYAVPRESILSFNNLTGDEVPEQGTRLFIPSV